MRSTFTQSGGVQIHCIDHGGDGPPVLLVHATGLHGRVWDPLVPTLRERFRVCALDLRGHGDSDKPDIGYRWESFGDDVLSAVEHFELEAVAAVGHSSGGAALVHAEASRPGTFSQLVLLDPVAPPPDIRGFFAGENNPLTAGARKRRKVWSSREEMVERLRSNSPMSTWRPEFVNAYVRHGTRAIPDGGVELKCPPEVEAQIYMGAGLHDAWERMQTLACPVLVLVGEHSHVWSATRREAIAASGCRVEVVGGAGHFLPMEDPEATMDHLLTFLA